MGKQQPKKFTPQEAERITKDANKLYQTLHQQLGEWKAYLKEITVGHEHLHPLIDGITVMTTSMQPDKTISVIYEYPDALFDHAKTLDKEHALYKALLEGGIEVKEEPIARPVLK